MFNLQEVDDGDENPDTRIFVIPIAAPMEFPVESVVIRANITPVLDENELPSCTSLQGGAGNGKLTRSVVRSISSGVSKTEFTFSCFGTDSGLRTTIYVYEAKVGLFADEGDLQNIDVGHSWGCYTISDDMRLDLVPSDYWDYLKEIGFWPSISGSGNCDGEVRLSNDAMGSHTPTGWKEYPVLLSTFLLALPQVKASVDSPPWYNLFNYNCTDYAIGLGEVVNIYTMDASGTSTPWVFSSWLDSH